MSTGKHAAEKKPSSVRGFFGFLAMIAVVFAVVMGFRAYVLEPFQIPSSSMETTIMTGDMVFAEKVSYNFTEPKPGEVAVFKDPQVPSRILIKRVIATGGQTVDIKNDKLYIDGVQVNESYTQGLPTKALVPASNVSLTYPYKIPDGYLWMMGDNRTNSADSRYFGPVEKSTVIGKAVLIYWPLDHFKAFTNN